MHLAPLTTLAGGKKSQKKFLARIFIFWVVAFNSGFLLVVMKPQIVGRGIFAHPSPLCAHVRHLEEEEQAHVFIVDFPKKKKGKTSCCCFVKEWQLRDLAQY